MSGSIRDPMRIMEAAVTHDAATYLYDRKTLVRWELMGLAYVYKRHDDWDRYKATDAGRAAFARGKLP